MSATRASEERGRQWLRVFANELHYRLHIFDRSSGDDAVAEIEDVSGTACGLRENLVDALANQLRLGEESDGVEVALHRAGVVERAPAFVERHAPVEAEHVGSGLAHGGEQAGGVDSEIDDGNAEGLHFADEDFRRGQHEVAIIGDAQRSGPAIEDLDDVGAGVDLLRGVFAEHER